MPAKAEIGDAAGSVVVGGFTSDPAGVPGFYQVYTPGTVTLTRSEQPGSALLPVVDEVWEAIGTDGSRFSAHLSFERGVPSIATFDNRVISGADPNLYRFYRGNNGVDLLHSTVTGVDRLEQIEVDAGGGMLAQIFDGSEELVSVITMPWYFRDTFVP